MESHPISLMLWPTTHRKLMKSRTPSRYSLHKCFRHCSKSFTDFRTRRGSSLPLLWHTSIVAAFAASSFITSNVVQTDGLLWPMRVSNHLFHASQYGLVLSPAFTVMSCTSTWVAEMLAQYGALCRCWLCAALCR